MAKKKGFMTPERKKKLRTLLRKKAAEELKKEQPEGLDKDELWCQLSKTPGVTEEFADQMISMIDTNGDGVIDFNECAQPPPASWTSRARVCD